jgi:uncharacterized protein (TIGR03067 family)
MGILSLEVDGSQMPDAMLSSSRLLIDGDRFRMESPEANYEGVFIIDVEQAPHHIDIDFVEGPEAGNRYQGIFQLEGDRFTICLGLVGAQRPDRFATSRGTGHALDELVRVEHARPSDVDGGTAQSPALIPPPVVADAQFEANVRRSKSWRASGRHSNSSPPENLWMQRIFRTVTEVTLGLRPKSFLAARRWFMPRFALTRRHSPSRWIISI